MVVPRAGQKKASKLLVIGGLAFLWRDRPSPADKFRQQADDGLRQLS
jgi:hypothetical protein